MPNPPRKRKELSPDVRRIQRDIGLKVRALRKREGLSQEAFAHAIDKTVHAVSSIERGIAFASLTTLLEITRVLNCRLEELFEINPLTPEAIEIRALVEMLKGQSVPLIRAAKQQIEILIKTVKSDDRPS